VTQDEIIRMAREACSPHQVLNTDLVFLERFAALVAANEREACAKVCDDYAEKCVEAENWEAEDVSLINAAAIREQARKV